ncbi:MAG: hypothetical protein IRY92_11010 [Dactylosporangium sp.]|nr:hypothetical protein [Dactylosporangium sp.]
MAVPDSPIRDPQITRLQRVRNLLGLATCIALIVGLVVAVRERMLETSTDTPA